MESNQKAVFKPYFIIDLCWLRKLKEAALPSAGVFIELLFLVESLLIFPWT